MTSVQQWLGSQRQALFSLLLLLTFNRVAADNPKDDFCRRFSHQSAIIDDKLYIDGGWVNYRDFAESGDTHDNTWLGYHDLNDLVTVDGNRWPDFNISLSKNDSIPSVAGGVLWPDSVNKRFYLYGGERMQGFPSGSYRLLSYDIIYDKWDDFGEPDISPAPEIAAFGAGVGVSETGRGYYYAGWISNTSMNGWSKNRTMTPNFYSYEYDTGEFHREASPDTSPRAEGGMVWIPAGDTNGLLVYMGGLVSPYDNETTAPQSLDEIFVYDTQDNRWSKQTATGETPQNRRQFCIDVAWAPDKSSFNIYLWGGLAVYPPVTDVTSYSDVYVLTLPSFTWVKAFPDYQGNATLKENGKYGSTCNMVKHMSQFFVIGGNYTHVGDDKCDDEDWWGVHNLWTGTSQNAGDNITWWELYDPDVTSNVVPEIVYNVTGGDKEGDATVTEPEGGFDSGNTLLSILMSRRPSIPERTPSRVIPGASSTSTSDLDSGSDSDSETESKSKLSTGAIVGIAIGGAGALATIVFAWYLFGKGIVQRREQRRQSQMTQQTQYTQHVQQAHQSYYGCSTAGTVSSLSRQSPPAQWTIATGPVSPDLHPPVAPTELPADNDRG
ncbi:hypothetical protein B0J13DRAFT_461829 [Dactylonectria estremocensis]|uniref:Kelch repeat protein n=1 Tax=Dactylonectria estremocensis TaxID=1079267 RepID=A0A9P9I9P1_9HYPO|nr:hypothetical protein B0J13DRAFT_461829 [Dactylonectria estremocensis]